MKDENCSEKVAHEIKWLALEAWKQESDSRMHSGRRIVTAKFILVPLHACCGTQAVAQIINLKHYVSSL